MKVTLTIWLLLATGMLFSQDQAIDYSGIDRIAPTYDASDPASLSRLLTEPYTSEKEKVRSIFRWITDHISYYRATPKNLRRRDRDIIYEEEDGSLDTGALKPLTERIALKVLKDRKAYCDGYSRLFQSLCGYAGIRSEIITGYARSDIDRVDERFRSNHSWNAVYIDTAWYLMDVTWASGFLSRSSEQFVKFYDDYYFMTPPEKFIRHHYPDDLRWTLLSNPPPLQEFRYTPFKQRSYVKYDITDYYPSRGIIEASVGDTIHIELETNHSYRYRPIAPDSLWDSSTLVVTPLYSFVKPDVLKPGKKISYSFPVESDKVEWLHIMYNNDAVLRYKLNVKKK